MTAADPRTVAPRLNSLRQNCGLEHVVMGGDRRVTAYGRLVCLRVLSPMGSVQMVYQPLQTRHRAVQIQRLGRVLRHPSQSEILLHEKEVVLVARTRASTDRLRTGSKAVAW